MHDTGTRSVERFAVRPTAGAVMILLALAAFAVVLGLVGAGWGPLHRLDLHVDDRLNGYFASRDAATSFWRGVTTVFQPATFEVVAAVVAVALWFRRRRRLALFAVATVAGSSALNNLVKVLVDRARPNVPITLTHAAGSSFPSGHAMSSFVSLALLAWVAHRLGRRALARGVAAACGLVIGLVGFSRMALGAHYLSDVVGAWLLGLAWLMAMFGAFGVARRHESRRVGVSGRRP